MIGRGIRKKKNKKKKTKEKWKKKGKRKNIVADYIPFVILLVLPTHSRAPGRLKMVFFFLSLQSDCPGLLKKVK